jgi:hypothetical protein
MNRLISTDWSGGDDVRRNNVRVETETEFDGSEQERRPLWGFRRTAQPPNMLPILMLHPDFAEQLFLVLFSLPDIIFLCLCASVVWFWGQMITENPNEAVVAVQKARQELEMMLAKSINEYNDAFLSYR